MKLIVFEGLDGSGKTTLIHLLKEALTQAYQQKVTIVRGLGDSVIGSQLRGMFLYQEKLTPLTRMWLSFANMQETQAEYLQPLNSQRNQIVFLDRWVASTYAYQIWGYQLKWSYTAFDQLQKNVFYQPDLTFYLDLPPQIGLVRKQKTASKERDFFEKQGLPYLEQVQKGYRNFLTQEENVKSYNALLPPRLLLTKILDFLEGRDFITPKTKVTPKKGG